jgi:hypothetical protein
MYRFCASRSIGRTRSGGATSQPRRQPVMQKYLEKPPTTIAWSAAASTLGAGVPYVMPW